MQLIWGLMGDQKEYECNICPSLGGICPNLKDTKTFLTQFFFGPQNSLDPKIFDREIFSRTQNFFDLNLFLTKKFQSGKNLFGP